MSSLVLSRPCFGKTSLTLYCRRPQLSFRIEGKMATMALELGDPGGSLIEEKEEIAEETGQPPDPFREMNDVENTKEAEGPRNCLLDVQDFDEQLLNDMKSGIVPFVEEYPSITIYLVPDTIRRVDEQAYTPRYLCFAIHYSFDHTYPKDTMRNQHASRHVHSMLSRNQTKTLEDYILALNSIKDRIKRCHYVAIDVNLKNLLFLLFSGFFIVDVFLMFYEGRLKPKVDTPCMSCIQDLWVDMLLLPNQVPFFALQLIFDMVVVDKSKFPSLVELSLCFFDQFVELNKQVPPLKSERVHHLLHLVHYHLLPSKLPNNPNHMSHNALGFIFAKLKNLWSFHTISELPISTHSSILQSLTIKPIPSAKRLQEAGIKFMKKDGSGFLDITFKKGVLEIPHIHIHSNTKRLLRNLTAWEQCHSTAGAYFTSYSIFMDYIVNTTKDVDILSESGIIGHSLGTDEEVAFVFNGLSTYLVCLGPEDNFLPYLAKKLNEYCENRFNIWRAKLMIDYFSSPWTVISLIAAMFLILLTVAQTFFSAFAYFLPP